MKVARASLDKKQVAKFCSDFYGIMAESAFMNLLIKTPATGGALYLVILVPRDEEEVRILKNSLKDGMLAIKGWSQHFTKA